MVLAHLLILHCASLVLALRAVVITLAVWLAVQAIVAFAASLRRHGQLNAGAPMFCNITSY